MGFLLRTLPLPALLVLVVVVVGAGPDLAAAAEPAAIVIKLRADGDHAVEACAEATSRAGRPLRGITRDDSESLDALHRALDVRQVRALFRRPDGRPLAQQRRDLRTRGADRYAATRPSADRAAAPDLSHVYRVRLGPGVDPAHAATRYAEDPHVLWAQPDFGMDLDFTPDDPFLFSSGSWGQPYGDLWGITRVRADLAWNESTGAGAVAAVIDTGIDYEHPDLAANVWVNPGEDLDDNGRVDATDWNGIDDDANGYVDDLRGWDFVPPEGDADPWDDLGHGTHVSGTIAAVGGNGIGVIGVAPQARIMALKGFDAAGVSRSSDLASAIVYAAHNGADVINNSWSCGSPCPRNPVIEEAVLLAHAHGVVVVTSAGNHRNDVVLYSPENLRETIVVAASREDDSQAPFSGHGILVDVAAPGSGRAIGGVSLASRNILSVLAAGAGPGWSAGTAVGGAYVRKTGTSMSAPHVAGVVALLRGRDPGLSVDDVRNLLRATARDLGPPGHDGVSGAGLVDAAAAMTRGVPPGVSGRFRSPRPAETLVPDGAPIALLGSAEGADFASYALTYGRGFDPVTWTPIPAASESAVRDGTLGLWDVSSLADGTWLLRLEVTAGDGERIVEFLPLGVERTRPYAVSSAGRYDFAPDVDGDLVVWASAPSVDIDTPPDEQSIRLEIADLRADEVIALPAHGDRRSPRLSGRRLAFTDLAREPLGEIGTCLFDRETGACPAAIVGAGPVPRSGPLVAGDQLLWIEQPPAGSRALRCDVGRGDDCAPIEMTSIGSPVEMENGGRRLVWRGTIDGITGLHTCRIERGAADCRPQHVDTNGYFGIHFKPTVSGRLFAWEGIALEGLEVLSELWVCRMSEDGHCPALSVARAGPQGLEATVSGNRVVWHGEEGDELRAIYFCEYDPVAHVCPVQRLSGSLAPQSLPRIDGQRVVFEDVRDGGSRIYALDLPGVHAFGARRVEEGRWLWLAIGAHDSVDGPIPVSATRLDGSPVEPLGMRLHSVGAWTVLLWRPEPGQAGRYAVRLTGETSRGLTTRETVEIEVTPRRRRPWRWFAWR